MPNHYGTMISPMITLYRTQFNGEQVDTLSGFDEIASLKVGDKKTVQVQVKKPDGTFEDRTYDITKTNEGDFLANRIDGWHRKFLSFLCSCFNGTNPTSASLGQKLSLLSFSVNPAVSMPHPSRQTAPKASTTPQKNDTAIFQYPVNLLADLEELPPKTNGVKRTFVVDIHALTKIDKEVDINKGDFTARLIKHADEVIVVYSDNKPCLRDACNFKRAKMEQIAAPQPRKVLSEDKVKSGSDRNDVELHKSRFDGIEKVLTSDDQAKIKLCTKDDLLNKLNDSTANNKPELIAIQDSIDEKQNGSVAGEEYQGSSFKYWIIKADN